MGRRDGRGGDEKRRTGEGCRFGEGWDKQGWVIRGRAVVEGCRCGAGRDASVEGGGGESDS